MDCVLMETSAYKELQAHLQRLLERVSALHSLSAQPTTVRWLTAEEVCKALSITKRALQYYRSAGIIPYTAILGLGILSRMSRLGRIRSRIAAVQESDHPPRKRKDRGNRSPGELSGKQVCRKDANQRPSLPTTVH